MHTSSELNQFNISAQLL